MTSGGLLSSFCFLSSLPIPLFFADSNSSSLLSSLSGWLSFEIRLLEMDRLLGSKALAAEVRILLQEVGKLRDEKRALQFEVAELLATKVSPHSSASKPSSKITRQYSRDFDYACALC